MLAILNSKSGGLKTADLDQLRALIVDRFIEKGKSAECVIFRGKHFDAFLSRTIASTQAGIVLVAGGDGTVSTAAALCLKHDKVLGVLPAGTMNLYARTLQLPLRIEDAIRALATAKVARCDIGTANGRPFVHQYSVGLQSKVIQERDVSPHRSRFRKMAAGLWAIASILRRPPSFPVCLERDGTECRELVSFVAVSNNLYGEAHLPYADHTDGALLGVYFARPLDSKANLKLIADLALGAWASNPDFKTGSAREVVLKFPGKKRRAKAVLDGELIALDDTVSIMTIPGALKVLKPVPVFPATS